MADRANPLHFFSVGYRDTCFVLFSMSKPNPNVRNKLRSHTPTPKKDSILPPLNTLVPPRSLSPPVKIRPPNYIESNSKSVVIFKRNLESTGRYSPFNPPKDIDNHGVIPLHFNPPKIGVWLYLSHSFFSYSLTPSFFLYVHLGHVIQSSTRSPSISATNLTKFY